MRLVVASAALLLAVLAAGCGTAAPTPPPPPVTVTSVDDWAAMTLSNGARVFDVDSGGRNSDTCEQDYLTGKGRALLVGREVVGYRRASSSPYATAPAGYRYGQFDYAGAPDGWEAVQQQYAGAALQACSPVTEQAPLSGRTVEPGTDRVDVDVDGDDDTSRFCRRHWYC